MSCPPVLGQTPSKVWHQTGANRPVLGKGPAPWGLCMIKVTSKIGSHKRAQSFAIVRPDSVGCPTRIRSVSVLCEFALGPALGSSRLLHRPQTIRYARPRVGWFWAVCWSRGWRRRGEERWCC